MHIDEFEAFLADRKIALGDTFSVGSRFSQSPKVAWAYDYWDRVYRGIAPHIDGTVPSAILKAFPNEGEEEMGYRLSTFQSPTKGLLTKAIADTNRVVMSPQFVMQYGEILNRWLVENPHAFDGIDTHLTLHEYLTVVVYPSRVKDPNAWLVVLPTNVAKLVYDEAQNLWVSDMSERQKKVGVKVMIYAYDAVVYMDSDIMIFAEPQVPEYTMQGFVAGFSLPVFYRVVTKNSSFLYNPTGASTGAKFGEFYKPTQDRNYMPCTRLGGKLATAKLGAGYSYAPITISYFESDFSYAEQAMNNLCEIESQRKTITNKTVYTNRIRRAIPCRAQGCENGKIAVLDRETGAPIINDAGRIIQHDCQSCSGTGFLKIGTQTEIVIPQNSGLSGDEKAPSIDDYVKIVSPPTDAVKEVREQVNEQTQNLRGLLTIVQQKTVGQSADSKEADEQDKYALLYQVAGGMARIADCILRSTCYYVVPPNKWEEELQQIHVITPRSFKIHSIEMLRALRDTNRELKDLHTRALESLMLLEAETADPMQVRVRELWQAYTHELCEALPIELDALDAHGDIGKELKLAALFGGAEIYKILVENPKIEDDQVFAELDIFFGEMVKNTEISTEINAALDAADRDVQTPIIEEEIEQE
jgi:hypothetical protein